jgi:pyruvate dehydrogenase E1 component alpha subunit/2-oxoisovalerate dehydrogenase E1 component alpha subunit
MTAQTSPQIAAASKALAGNHGFSLISDEKLLALYAALLHGRMIEEQQRSGSGGNRGSKCGAGCGHEAPVVATCIDLHREDTLVAPPDTLIHAFVKGAPLESIAAWLAPSSSADAEGAQSRRSPGSLDSASLASWNVVSPASPEAVAVLNAGISAALTHKIADDDKIVVVFFAGDAEDPDSREALHFTLEQQLPMLLVLHATTPQSNHRGTGKSSQNAAVVPLRRIASFGIPCLPVDGADMVAIYRAASESIARIRQGRGPTLLECIDVADGLDPIAKMEAYLDRKGLFQPIFKELTQATFTAALAAAGQVSPWT